MVRSFRLTGAVGALALVAVGCSDQSSPVAPQLESQLAPGAAAAAITLLSSIDGPTGPSCAAIRSANPGAGDGEYTLVVQRRTARIYCADMAGTPKEYITLAHTGANVNYSFSPGGHVVYNSRNYVIQGTDAHTSYLKIRVDPVTLVVDQSDVGFINAISIGANGYDPENPGFKPTPVYATYGYAADCYNLWSALGRANVDLTGTDFAFGDGVNFQVNGFAPNGSVDLDPNRQVVNLVGGGWCGGAGPVGPFVLKLLTPEDAAAPVTLVVAPAGWRNHDVALTLSATDDLTGVASTYWQLDGGPQQQGTSVVVSAEGAHEVSYWSVDQAGNVEAKQTVTVQIDKSVPSIAGVASTIAWTNQDVTATFTCADSLSGVKTCQTPITVSTEGANQSAFGNAEDNAGNTASATVGGINVDKTAPTIAFTGNAGTYTVDQTVAITCAASDALSGVASTTCSNVSGDAYTFAIGANSVTASATDKAGNVGNGSTSFTLDVTSAGVCALTKRWVNKFESPALCMMLSRGMIKQYVLLMRAQAGKSIPAAKAATLIKLANALPVQTPPKGWNGHDDDDDRHDDDDRGGRGNQGRNGEL